MPSSQPSWLRNSGRHSDDDVVEDLVGTVDSGTQSPQKPPPAFPRGRSGSDVGGAQSLSSTTRSTASGKKQWRNITAGTVHGKNLRSSSIGSGTPSRDVSPQVARSNAPPGAGVGVRTSAFSGAGNTSAGSRTRSPQAAGTPTSGGLQPHSRREVRRPDGRVATPGQASGGLQRLDGSVDASASNAKPNNHLPALGSGRGSQRRRSSDEQQRMQPRRRRSSTEVDDEDEYSDSFEALSDSGVKRERGLKSSTLKSSTKTASMRDSRRRRSSDNTNGAQNDSTRKHGRQPLADSTNSRGRPPRAQHRRVSDRTVSLSPRSSSRSSYLSSARGARSRSRSYSYSTSRSRSSNSTPRHRRRSYSHSSRSADSRSDSSSVVAARTTKKSAAPKTHHGGAAATTQQLNEGHHHHHVESQKERSGGDGHSPEARRPSNEISASTSGAVGVSPPRHMATYPPAGVGEDDDGDEFKVVSGTPITSGSFQQSHIHHLQRTTGLESTSGVPPSGLSTQAPAGLNTQPPPTADDRDGNDEDGAGDASPGIVEIRGHDHGDNDDEKANLALGVPGAQGLAVIQSALSRDGSETSQSRMLFPTPPLSVKHHSGRPGFSDSRAASSVSAGHTPQATPVAPPSHSFSTSTRSRDTNGASGSHRGDCGDGGQDPSPPRREESLGSVPSAAAGSAASFSNASAATSGVTPPLQQRRPSLAKLQNLSDSLAATTRSQGGATVMSESRAGSMETNQHQHRLAPIVEQGDDSPSAGGGHSARQDSVGLLGGRQMSDSTACSLSPASRGAPQSISASPGIGYLETGEAGSPGGSHDPRLSKLLARRDGSRSRRRTPSTHPDDDGVGGLTPSTSPGIAPPLDHVNANHDDVRSQSRGDGDTGTNRRLDLGGPIAGTPVSSDAAASPGSALTKLKQRASTRHEGSHVRKSPSPPEPTLPPPRDARSLDATTRSTASSAAAPRTSATKSTLAPRTSAGRAGVAANAVSPKASGSVDGGSAGVGKDILDAISALHDIACNHAKTCKAGPPSAVAAAVAASPKRGSITTSLASPSKAKRPGGKRGPGADDDEVEEWTQIEAAVQILFNTLSASPPFPEKVEYMRQHIFFVLHGVLAGVESPRSAVAKLSTDCLGACARAVGAFADRMTQAPARHRNSTSSQPDGVEPGTPSSTLATPLQKTDGRRVSSVSPQGGGRGGRPPASPCVKQSTAWGGGGGAGGGGQLCFDHFADVAIALLIAKGGAAASRFLYDGTLATLRDVVTVGASPLAALHAVLSVSYPKQEKAKLLWAIALTESIEAAPPKTLTAKDAIGRAIAGLDCLVHDAAAPVRQHGRTVSAAVYRYLRDSEAVGQLDTLVFKTITVPSRAEKVKQSLLAAEAEDAAAGGAARPGSVSVQALAGSRRPPAANDTAHVTNVTQDVDASPRAPSSARAGGFGGGGTARLAAGGPRTSPRAAATKPTEPVSKTPNAKTTAATRRSVSPQTPQTAQSSADPKVGGRTPLGKQPPPASPGGKKSTAVPSGPAARKPSDIRNPTKGTAVISAPGTPALAVMSPTDEHVSAHAKSPMKDGRPAPAPKRGSAFPASKTGHGAETEKTTPRGKAALARGSAGGSSTTSNNARKSVTKSVRDDDEDDDYERVETPAGLGSKQTSSMQAQGFVTESSSASFAMEDNATAVQQFSTGPYGPFSMPLVRAAEGNAKERVKAIGDIVAALPNAARKSVAGGAHGGGGSRRTSSISPASNRSGRPPAPPSPSLVDHTTSDASASNPNPPGLVSEGQARAMSDVLALRCADSDVDVKLAALRAAPKVLRCCHDHVTRSVCPRWVSAIASALSHSRRDIQVAAVAALAPATPPGPDSARHIGLVAITSRSPLAQGPLLARLADICHTCGPLSSPSAKSSTSTRPSSKSPSVSPNSKSDQRAGSIAQQVLSGDGVAVDIKPFSSRDWNEVAETALRVLYKSPFAPVASVSREAVLLLRAVVDNGHRGDVSSIVKHRSGPATTEDKAALEQALAAAKENPDAIVLGVNTGA